MRLTLLPALVLLAAPALADDHLTPAQTMRMAAVRTYNPTGPGQIGGGAHAFGPTVGGYIPPALTNSYLIGAGDSRTEGANNHALIYPNASTFIMSASFDRSHVGWLFPMSGNAYIPDLSYNYGVGTSSTASLAARIISGATGGTFCGNGYIGVTAPCYNGTALSVGTSGITSTTFQSAAANVGLIGYNLEGADRGSVLSANTKITNVVGTTVTFAPPAIAAITSGLTFYAVPSTQINPYWNYLAAGNYDSQSNDSLGNIANFGSNLCTDNPSKVVYLLDGTNDLQFSSTSQSLLNLQTILTALGPAGCNKIVVAANEITRGLATGTVRGGYEVHTPSAGSLSATNTATFYDTIQLCYTPGANSVAGTAWTLNANDGLCLSSHASPALGQFVDNGSGSYTVNASDTASIGIAYRSYSFPDPVSGPYYSSYLMAIHNYLSSNSCADPWVDVQNNNTSYPGVHGGAQCPGKFPWVTFVDTWSASIDAAAFAATHQHYNIPFSMGDGLHPQQSLGRTLASLMWAATPSYAKPSSVKYPAPTINNPGFQATPSNLATAYGVNNCGLPTGTPKNTFLTALSPSANTFPASYGLPNNTATVVNNTFPGLGVLYVGQNNIGITGSATFIDCIDPITNVMHINNGTATTGSTITFMLQKDNSATPSILPNGMFDHAATWATPMSNCSATTCGTAGIPGSMNGSAGAGTSSTLSGAITTAGSNIVTSPNAYGASPLGGAGILYPSAVLTDTGGCIPANTRILSAYQTGTYQGVGSPQWNVVMSANATGNCSGDMVTASVAAMNPKWSTPLYWVSQITNTTFATPGGMGVSYALMTNPEGDGQDSFDVVLSGVTGGAAPAVTLKNTLMGTPPGTRSTLSNVLSAITNAKMRAQCHIELFPGPNGHLWGVQQAAVSAGNTSSAVFTAPYQSGAGLTHIPNTTLSYTGTAGNMAASSTEYTDSDITSGPVSYQSMTPWTDTTGMTTPYFATSVTIIANASAPVSATIRIKGCWAAQVTEP